MPGLNWVQAVNPNYLLIAPELTILVAFLFIMIADFYVKEKRILVWSTVGFILLALGFLWFGATSEAIQEGINRGVPLEFFGNMMVADQFSFFLRGVLLAIVALVTMLSIDYVEKFLKGMFLEFYQILLAATMGMMFMVGSRDLITIYIGLELASISSYVLAGLLRRDAKSNEAALKYFLNGALASAILLFGVSLIYGVSGTTYLPDIAGALSFFATTGDAGIIALVSTGVLFVVLGFAFKVAAVPMHLWAPDVYEGAPTPVTAFFSIGPKGAAFGAMLRIFLVGFGVAEFAGRWALMLAVMATASMFIGNLTALMQSNVKRMMAYSSIAQAGYILVGVVAAGSLEPGAGTAAVLFYIMAYALTNVGIFAILTHMDTEGGWVNVSDFKGLSQRNPFYAWALLVFFVSLIGIPPTVGFLGKFFLFRAALDTGYLWLALVMAVNSVISVGYYYGVVKAMFLESTEKEPLPFSGGAMATVVIAFVGVILVTLLANPFIGLTEAAAVLIP